MDPYRMRRSSFTPQFSASNQEPLIVVEESGAGEEDEPPSNRSSPRNSLDIDSPVNPYLLSPWRDPRDTRKHSLPTPQCTTGITASQVRRLSERGGEGSGPSPREAAFLATLSQAPAPTPGGRRHSVVTISKVPPALFGRNRRESIAAFPTGSNRRESLAGPPSTDHRGSVHNLQLDIMDDIVQARKARMRLWNTSSEKVCEVQTLDEGETTSPMRYTNRRYSDFVGTQLPPIQSHRRASEMPCIVSPALSPAAIGRKIKAGIVCTNTDLVGLLSSLTSSATEINKCEETPSTPAPPAKKSSSPEHRRSSMRSSRSNSFDVSVLNNCKQFIASADEKSSVLTGWFAKRHQPMATKKTKESGGRLKWDSKSPFVDAHMIGSAIEGFLRRGSGSSSSSSKGAIPKENARGKKPAGSKSPSMWFSKGDEDDSKDSCDSSLCSTLKDLFVK
ncbi:uncharacterized protein LOC132259776 [Phlebotomus argentipes]|uniref:uncharacterized protein LOC132259776 n=1 Tax=Phlebotomus argentipes TaxID=94469 RepID=UPI0028937472|nr:uncharacterized protein LOC132259776 [Phlebotomus argentipes]